MRSCIRFVSTTPAYNILFLLWLLLYFIFAFPHLPTVFTAATSTTNCRPHKLATKNPANKFSACVGNRKNWSCIWKATKTLSNVSKLMIMFVALILSHFSHWSLIFMVHPRRTCLSSILLRKLSGIYYCTKDVNSFVDLLKQRLIEM